MGDVIDFVKKKKEKREKYKRKIIEDLLKRSKELDLQWGEKLPEDPENPPPKIA